MKKFFNWGSFFIIGTALPLILSAMSLCYINIEKESKEIHSYNNEYRKKQRENMKIEQRKYENK
ncbi:conserved Plasmodium protein, unknown function [Plasmodium yoelii]|uniref:Uncharacterized protein n=1 Tax=Plasmodium yoelii TaxID=5861 RepID=A0A078K320_PLAYE|nr:conserved Plasmodium protein, unknown function [Plasmodium yoelii]CDU15960.1 conserved Plasmodium protein, unknown function [Plasmodium yoelii]VTZ71555.1 conserved Plasmodium protein, unknown function [Plasmodium yoelii]|eukprot:XP_022811270.1 conserved Plasmodium protein, unknown function [Plasmodium yoelii]